jgi:hypothetical protein
MPPVKNVGEPCAGEPHARFDAAAGGNRPVGHAVRPKRLPPTLPEPLALVARHRDPYERKPALPPPERHIDATQPCHKVQLDCFYVGRLAGTKGTVWQYTAIDVEFPRFRGHLIAGPSGLAARIGVHAVNPAVFA